MQTKRKQRRKRPPQKLIRPLTVEELLQIPEFRRWRYHAPTSLKRQAYETLRRLAGKAAGSKETTLRWVERVKRQDAP